MRSNALIEWRQRRVIGRLELDRVPLRPEPGDFGSDDHVAFRVKPQHVTPGFGCNVEISLRYVSDAADVVGMEVRHHSLGDVGRIETRQAQLVGQIVLRADVPLEDVLHEEGSTLGDPVARVVLAGRVRPRVEEHQPGLVLDDVGVDGEANLLLPEEDPPVGRLPAAVDVLMMGKGISGRDDAHALHRRGLLHGDSFQPTPS